MQIIQRKESKQLMKMRLIPRYHPALLQCLKHERHNQAAQVYIRTAALGGEEKSTRRPHCVVVCGQQSVAARGLGREAQTRHSQARFRQLRFAHRSSVQAPTDRRGAAAPPRRLSAQTPLAEGLGTV